MAKRGYKLQEFVAHSTNVNCLSIGKRACRLFITGGDDHKVNLWSIGKPTSLMCLCGHTSPVESVAFDTAEVLVLAGAATGVIKLWDLEEAKMVRGLTGHRSNCTAVEFHPFGEFFASGSTDTNLKIWDIRKKGCIHTYKGHTRGISTIRFTPDGRWVVSGGFDNVVKVWDLTAGKLLHDFKFHEGHIRSIDFHPLEFLLATGSADRTVKFWDLETFELIGSSRPEASGVRSISFHPDGRTLFSGLDDCLKVYSWEPVICHDAVDLGWSTLGDLCIHEEKLLGCSYYQNSVGVWVADLSLIEPHGAGLVPSEVSNDQKFDIPGSYSLDKAVNGFRSTLGLRFMSPDYEAKGIKNIYVDSAGGNAVASQGVGSLSSPKVVPLDSKETNLPANKESSVVEVYAKSCPPALSKSFAVHTVVPHDNTVEKDSSKPGRETITFSKTRPGMLLRPAHTRKPSHSKNDIEMLSLSLESGTLSNIASEKEGAENKKLQNHTASEDGAQKSHGEKASSVKSVTEKLEKIYSPEKPSNDENCDESIDFSKGIPSVKIVNGVAVVAGRTRTLVERFEKREISGNVDQATNITQVVQETIKTPTTLTDVVPQVTSEKDRTFMASTNMTPSVAPEMDLTPITASIGNPPITPSMGRTPIIASTMTHSITPAMDRRPVIASTVTPFIAPAIKRTPTPTSTVTSCVTPAMDRTPMTVSVMTPCVTPAVDRKPIKAANVIPRVTPEVNRSSVKTSSRAARVTSKMDTMLSIATNMTPCVIPERDRTPLATNMTSHIIPEMDAMPSVQQEEPQISGRDLTAANYKNVTEELMLSHEVFLSSLKSRLTKLQVVRHFWERNDMKGAISALGKLPDHSVHADVISVLMEKMEILTLDIFSGLLPVLVGLLDSKIERHANVSLEMLLKLVAVFGPVIHSAVSAPPAVGIDLHAEQRIECCRQCFTQLQKIQQILPALISRKGGSLAKHAQELNLVLLQES